MQIDYSTTALKDVPQGSTILPKSILKKANGKTHIYTRRS